MATVGIKDLKANLSKYVRRAASGKEITITERGVPVAAIVPVSPELRALHQMRRRGLIRWSGGKPDFKPIKVRSGDADVSGAVIEEREEDERRM